MTNDPSTISVFLPRLPIFGSFSESALNYAQKMLENVAQGPFMFVHSYAWDLCAFSSAVQNFERLISSRFWFWPLRCHFSHNLKFIIYFYIHRQDSIFSCKTKEESNPDHKLLSKLLNTALWWVG